MIVQCFAYACMYVVLLGSLLLTLIYFCLQCACVDPDNQGPAAPKCGLPEYKGDGNCDDENNNAGCWYDGGNCCPETVQGGKVKTKYCTKVSCEGHECYAGYVVIPPHMCGLIITNITNAINTAFVVLVHRPQENVRITQIFRRWKLRRRQQQRRVLIRWRRLLRRNGGRRQSCDKILQ